MTRDRPKKRRLLLARETTIPSARARLKQGPVVQSHGAFLSDRARDRVTTTSALWPRAYVLRWEVSHDTETHAVFRGRRDPRVISRGSGNRRAAEPVMRRPANDSRQFELGAGLGFQHLRGRRYPLRGHAAAKLEQPHVGQPVRRRVLPSVALASSLLERRGYAPALEPPTQRPLTGAAAR